MKEFSKADLLYELRRQYPSHPTTFGGCAGNEENCLGFARGCGLCKNCCEVKLNKAGCDPLLVTELMAKLSERQSIQIEAQDAPWKAEDLRSKEGVITTAISALLSELSEMKEPA